MPIVRRSRADLDLSKAACVGDDGSGNCEADRGRSGYGADLFRPRAEPGKASCSAPCGSARATTMRTQARSIDLRGAT